MSRDRMQPATVGPLAQVCSARSAQCEAGLIDLVVSFAMPFSCYCCSCCVELCPSLSLGFSGPALFAMLWIAFLCASYRFLVCHFRSPEHAPNRRPEDSIAVWICLDLFGILLWVEHVRYGIWPRATGLYRGCWLGWIESAIPGRCVGPSCPDVKMGISNPLLYHVVPLNAYKSDT
jgi:hypothetical protein